MTAPINTMTTPNPDGRSFRPGPIAAGVILFAAGTAMYLDTAGVVDINFRHLFVPLLLITLGTAMLDRGPIACGHRASAAVDSGQRRRRRGGATGGIWLIGVGAWMLVSQNHIFGLTFHNSWPLFIVLSGIIMVIRGFK
jgi:hypothetical protein